MHRQSSTIPHPVQHLQRSSAFTRDGSQGRLLISISFRLCSRVEASSSAAGVNARNSNQLGLPRTGSDCLYRTSDIYRPAPEHPHQHLPASMTSIGTDSPGIDHPSPVKPITILRQRGRSEATLAFDCDRESSEWREISSVRTAAEAGAPRAGKGGALSSNARYPSCAVLAPLEPPSERCATVPLQMRLVALGTMLVVGNGLVCALNSAHGMQRAGRDGKSPP